MLTVQIANDFHGIKFSEPKLRKLIRFVCRRFGLKKATVSIAIVDNRQMLRTNTRFLNRRSATDCLSFDLSDNSDSEGAKSFEVIVNGQKAVQEAPSRGHSPEAELALYVTHGLLHNLGFDDSTAVKAKKIHLTEDEILQRFGYGLVYNKRK